MKRILSLALLITMTISLCACNDERVVYPVEVVKPEKTLEEDTETKDSEAAEEKTEEKADNESDVELTEVGSEKIKVIKVVREVTGLGLKEAKEAVDGAPKVLKEQASKEDAEAIKAKLEEVGAKVTLK